MENEDLRNLGIRLGDCLLGEEGEVMESKTPRFRLSRLLVLFFRDPVTSSTEDEDDMKSLFLRVPCHPPSSAGVVGTEQFLGRL